MGIKYIFNPTTGSLDAVSVETPAGADTEIQFNNAGVFGADSDLTWDDTSTPKVLGVGGDINLDDGGTYTTTLQTITPTAARTISFPDATGTVGLVGGSSGNLVVNQSGAYAGVANSSVDNATGNITLGSRFISSLERCCIRTSRHLHRHLVYRRHGYHHQASGADRAHRHHVNGVEHQRHGLWC
jgi:hypothetical protein